MRLLSKLLLAFTFPAVFTAASAFEPARISLISTSQDLVHFDVAGTLKKLVTESVNEYFAPIRARRAELLADEAHLLDVLHAGNTRAREVATDTLDAVRTAMNMRY